MVQTMRTLDRFARLTMLAVGLHAPGCASRPAPQTTVILDASATVPPQLVRQGKVELPTELANRSCRSGTTVVQVDVDVAGRVVRASVIKESGEPTFDRACMQSGSASEYRPATSHGSPIRGVTKLECRLTCP